MLVCMIIVTMTSGKVNRHTSLILGEMGFRTVERLYVKKQILNQLTKWREFLLLMITDLVFLFFVFDIFFLSF